jgi:hypothetical protein
MRMVRQRLQERDGMQEAQHSRATGPANLNIIKCPQCGKLIPESALDALKVSTVAMERKAPEILTLQGDNSALEREVSRATPPPQVEPPMSAPIPGRAPVAGQLPASEPPARPRPKPPIVIDEDPFDWKRERC